MDKPTHSLPLFEGRWSHRHAPAPLSELKAEADRLLAEGAMGAPETFVQFAGFPRSGHSLVGALIGAAPGASIAHELDAMSLLAADFSGEQISALAQRNAEDFAASGHWWNGYRYHVEAPEADRSAPSRVLGDKKGDRALRKLAEEPGLLMRLRDAFPGVRLPWIVVLRNPFDNVATMSLRKGRHYDRLRIQASRTDQTPVLEASSQVPRQALPGMVKDYETLSETLAWLLRELPPRNVLLLRHEDLIEAPMQEIARLLEFLDLPAEEAFLQGASRLVARQPHRSRHEVTWPPKLRERLETLISRHEFLAGYGWTT